MNERIRELYKNVLASSENMRWNIEDAEKFAELIVRECADLCERIAKVHLEEENPIAYVYGSRQCRDTIKQYFGVEE